MNGTVRQALALWRMEGAQAQLAAQRENTVWRVRHGGADYALRLHRPGYRSPAHLRSELEWMAMLAEGGLAVPRPVAMPDGALTGRAGAHHVSLLAWLPGRPAGAQGALEGVADPGALAQQLGAMMAHMHSLSDAWTPPPGFTRPDWRRAGLLGEAPLWGRFWEHPALGAGGRAVMLDARAAANEALRGIEAEADQGLIHADLLAENLMLYEGRLAFIDFDDAAWGFRDFELATFLLKFRRQPYYAELRAGLIAGYGARRAVDGARLDLFMLLRALTYPGWIMARMDEPGAAERSARMLQTALELAQDFLRRR